MATKAPGPPKSTTPSSGTTATLRALYSAMQSIEVRGQYSVLNLL